jgi:hypothetical protein
MELNEWKGNALAFDSFIPHILRIWQGRKAA